MNSENQDDQDEDDFQPHESLSGDGEEPGAIEPLVPARERPKGPVARRTYTTGREELDRLVTETLQILESGVPAGAAAGSGPAAPLDPASLELAREMLTSSLRLVLQRATRAELKLVNSALKEFAYSFRVFAPYRDLPKVSIFGSARVAAGEPAYAAARDFAIAIAAKGWMVITGAGPGIMAAGHEGAGAPQSFGANIQLPAYNPANAYIAKDDKLINFKYFFTRKVTFLKESSAFVLLPGGLGTLDETFELLTLIQTGKSDLHPVVLLEPAGSTYWHRWLEFLREEVLQRGFILESDLSLLCIANSAQEAVEEVEAFYRNYESARFVGDRLILRLKQAPSPDELTHLNRDFADLLDEGSFEVIEATAAEKRDEDSLNSDRLAFFPKHAYGRIRELIDVLNRIPHPEANPV